VARTKYLKLSRVWVWWRGKSDGQEFGQLNYLEWRKKGSNDSSEAEKAATKWTRNQFSIGSWFPTFFYIHSLALKCIIYEGIYECFFKSITYFSQIDSMTMHIKFFYNSTAIYEDLKTLYPGGIWTRDLLFWWRTRWPLCHAARAAFMIVV
jgi:hypothetical protein